MTWSSPPRTRALITTASVGMSWRACEQADRALCERAEVGGFCQSFKRGPFFPSEACLFAIRRAEQARQRVDIAHVLCSFCRSLGHDLRHGGDLAQERAHQGRTTHTSGRAVGELDVDDGAAHECLAATGCFDRAAAAECQTRTGSEPVRRQHIDRRTGTRVAMSNAVSAGKHLTEASVDECLVNSGEACRFDPQIDDNVDIISGTRVERCSFDLEQEDHLPTDQQTMVAEMWCQLDEGAPRLLLSTGDWWQSHHGVVRHRQPGPRLQSSAVDQLSREGPGRPHHAARARRQR